MKLDNTLRQLLVSPKDPAKKEEMCGAVYMINCVSGQEEEKWHSFYVEEICRTLKTHTQEHQQTSLNHLWCHNTFTLVGGHPTKSLWRVYRSSTGRIIRPSGTSRSPSTSECSTQTSMQLTPSGTTT